MQYPCRKQTDAYYKARDSLLPNRFFILHPKNISFTNLLQKKYLAIKSQLFKKEVPIKSLFSLYLLG